MQWMGNIDATRNSCSRIVTYLLDESYKVSYSSRFSQGSFGFNCNCWILHSPARKMIGNYMFSQLERWWEYTFYKHLNVYKYFRSMQSKLFISFTLEAYFTLPLRQLFPVCFQLNLPFTVYDLSSFFFFSLIMTQKFNNLYWSKSFKN